jgi:hypothetical protein
LIGEHGQSWEEQAERPKRQQRAAHLKQRRDPMMSYAFPPSFGSYRSSW